MYVLYVACVGPLFTMFGTVFVSAGVEVRVCDFPTIGPHDRLGRVSVGGKSVLSICMKLMTFFFFLGANCYWCILCRIADGSRASLLKVLELEQRGTEKYEQETIKEVYFQLTLIMLAEGQRRSSESSFRQFIGDRIRSLSDRVQKLESGEVAEETLGELSSKKKDLARFRYLQDKKLTRLDYEAKHFLRLEFQQFQEEMQRKAAEAEARRLEDEEANRRRREEMRRLREERAGVGGGGGSSVIGGFGGSGGLGSGGGGDSLLLLVCSHC